MKKIILVLLAMVVLSGCSYSSSYLAGRPMSQEQYKLIRNSIDDGTIQKGMTYDEVYSLLGPAQRRFMNTWTYDTGPVDYITGQSRGSERFQFNFKDGELKSIYYFGPGIFGWRNVLRQSNEANTPWRSTGRRYVGDGIGPPFPVHLQEGCSWILDKSNWKDGNIPPRDLWVWEEQCK